MNTIDHIMRLNEHQGKSGEQGWTIARRCIAIATHQGGSFGIGRQISPGVVQAHTVTNCTHIKSLLFLIKSISYNTRCAAFIQYAG